VHEWVSSRLSVSRSAWCPAPRPMLSDRAHPPPATVASPSSAPTSPVKERVSLQPRGVLLELARSPLPLAVVAVRALARRAVTNRGEGTVRVLRVAGVLGVAGLATWGALATEPTSASLAETQAGSGRVLVEAFGQIRTAALRARSGDAEGVDSLARADRPFALSAEPVLLPGAAGRPPVSADSPSSSVRHGRPIMPSRRVRSPILHVLPPGLPVGFPVSGAVSSPFGVRVHPVTHRVRLHRGVDLAVPLGTPVVATAAGRVLSSGRRGGYGLAVEIGHRGADGFSTSTLYAHLSALPVGLRVGSRVRRHSVIGFSGGVGPGAGVSTGPHVHYEVRLRGAAVDPVTVAEGVHVQRLTPVRTLIRRPLVRSGPDARARDRRRTSSRGVP
jgi:murein DD-endopeptidase MepM/ murein hydrolase activator NlpD